MKRIFTLLFMLGLGLQHVDAQKVAFIEAFKLKRQAKASVAAGDHYGAADHLDEFMEYRPGKVKQKFWLAELEFKARNYDKALTLFQEVLAEDEEKYPEAMLSVAQIQKIKGDYEGAKESLAKFKKLSKNMKDAGPYRKIQKAELKGCDLVGAQNDSVDAIVKHLENGVNYNHIEFSPIPVDDNTVIFGSLRSDTNIKYDPRDTTVKVPVRKFYVANKIEGSDNDWENKEMLAGPFNDYNVGNGALSPDGMRFYFTDCGHNYKGESVCAIMISEKKEDGSWSKPKKMGPLINDPLYTSTQPTIGADAKYGREILYFVSNRPGGRGGLDIWYTIYNPKKNTWKTPKNLGSKVNTPGDEMTPFYDLDSRQLYFSSTGQPGIGGLDIFKTAGDQRKWVPAENMGEPFNSSYDDLYFRLHKNRKEGFLTSNRDGALSFSHPHCCDDVFSFMYTKFIEIDLETQVFAQNDEEKTPFLGVDVSLMMVRADMEEPILLKKLSSNENGVNNFILEAGNQYQLVFEKEGYLTASRNLSTEEIKESQTLEIKDVMLQPEEAKTFILENVYFDFDKATLKEESKTIIDEQLITLLNANPSIKIELGAHTDSKGNDDYNMKLSQRRAETIVNYLIDAGIAKNRLTAKGYGETKPIADNTNADGSDNPEGRARNRRVEFTIIGQVKVKRKKKDEDEDEDED